MSRVIGVLACWALWWGLLGVVCLEIYAVPYSMDLLGNIIGHKNVLWLLVCSWVLVPLIGLWAFIEIIFWLCSGCEKVSLPFRLFNYMVAAQLAVPVLLVLLPIISVFVAGMPVEEHE